MGDRRLSCWRSCRGLRRVGHRSEIPAPSSSRSDAHPASASRFQTFHRAIVVALEERRVNEPTAVICRTNPTDGPESESSNSPTARTEFAPKPLGKRHPEPFFGPVEDGFGKESRIGLPQDRFPYHPVERAGLLESGAELGELMVEQRRPRFEPVRHGRAIHLGQQIVRQVRALLDPQQGGRATRSPADHKCVEVVLAPAEVDIADDIGTGASSPARRAGNGTSDP